MKIIKWITAILLAIIFGFATTYILSYINVKYTSEFLPIPHFIANLELSFRLGLIFIISIYLLFFIYLVNKKYINFGFSMLGMILGVIKYKSVSESFLPNDMGFVPGLLELGKLLLLFMGIGIIVQWVFDGGLASIRLVSKSRK